VVCRPDNEDIVTGYLQQRERRENYLRFFAAGKTRGIFKFGEIQGKQRIFMSHSKLIALGIDGGHIAK